MFVADMVLRETTLELMHRVLLKNILFRNSE